MKLTWGKLAIIGLLIGSFYSFGLGQNKAAKANTKKTQLSNWEKTWSLKASIYATFDSNFDHEPIGTKSFGAIPSLDFGYQLKKDKQRFQFQYAVGAPKYTKFPEYSHPGQYFRASYRYSFDKNWSTETEAEAMFRGINEDRELNNQLILSQKLNYRFLKANKLSFVAAYRLKRKSRDPNQDANNPQIGVKYTRELTNKIDVYGGFRYDQNNARGERQKYLRRTFTAGADLNPTTSDSINIEARYAPRLYGRLIDVNGSDVPRSDQKFTFDIKWRRECKSRFGVENMYGYERRNSNDVDKKYKSHQFVVALYYRWGSKEN